MIARIAYGAIFMIAAPALLWWWAQASAGAVQVPAFRCPWIGITVLVIGIVLMGMGMLDLWRHGGGLPMNAYPPQRYVQQGVYGWMPHPIYAGFTGVCLGCSVWSGSASGLWLVTPCTALALWALVQGYERGDLEDRFGTRSRPWLALPPDEDGPIGQGQRLATAMLIFLPWLALYEGIHLLGRPPDAFNVYLPGEQAHGLWPWTEWIYASDYLVPLIVLIPGTARELRRLAMQGLIATAVLTLIYLSIPVVSPALPVKPDGVTGELMQLERAWSINAVAAFPSFHVVWAFLAAEAMRRRSRRIGVIAYLWAIAVMLSCIGTGMHAALDTLAGAAAAWLFIRYDRVWEMMRSGSQRIANSRRDWRFGPIRIINHGIYAGIGAATGIWVIGCLSGVGEMWAIVLVGSCALVGAALWAQLVEGSPHLLRPYGYYGSIYGGAAGLLLSWMLGADAIVLLGAFAAAAPFIQAWGRLRCLVQGCCHGHPAPAWLGIVYDHPQSRVVKLAQLGGVHLHPTQLYSILGNAAIGALLIRLWFLAAPTAFIAGGYLILSGIARFVEEAYRGEPQTIRLARLPIYQWLAILSVIAGVVLTTWHAGSAPAPHLGGWTLVSGAVAFGLVTWIAMGVDFPESHWRFSRLT